MKTSSDVASTLSTFREELNSIKENQKRYEEQHLQNKAVSAVAASVVAGDDAAAQAMQLQEMSHAIQRLKCMVDKFDQDLHSAERHLDDLEQYGRRNCLILHGGKTETLKEASYSDFEKFVLKLLNNRLKLDFDIKSEDIDNSSDGRVVWSVCFLSCRLGFDSESGQTNDFKIGIHSFPA